MGNIIIGHGQNRNLGHGTGPSCHDSRSLIERGQVAVQVAGEALTGRDLSLGGRHLPERLRVGSHIRQDYQNVHPLLKRQILRQRQGDFRSDQTLHYRVICQVDKHGHMLRYTALFKRPAEEISHIVLHAHSSEHNGELLIGIVPQGCLLDNLGGQLVVGKAVS